MIWLSAHPLGKGATTVFKPLSGDWYTLAHFGTLRLTIGYYVDALTVAMFTMVTLVARASTSTPSATCTKSCRK